MARVLLIEDDPLMVRMYQRKLVNDGYEAMVAVDGEDGLVKVRSFRPDLVLLDIMMPKLNGLQVLERLKSDPTTAKTPVVILTNLGGTQDDIERGLDLGAVAYLVKSAYRPDEVIAKVKEVLEGYTHSREIPRTAVESLGGAVRVLEATEQAAAPKREEQKRGVGKSREKKQDAEAPKEVPVDGPQVKKSKKVRIAHPVIREVSGEEKAKEEAAAPEASIAEEDARFASQSNSGEQRAATRERTSESVPYKEDSVPEPEKKPAAAALPQPQPKRKDSATPQEKKRGEEDAGESAPAADEMIW